MSRALRGAARRLRERTTPAERVLWKALRRRHLNGLRFRRQHAVGRFVLDFFCAERKLAVEVDGGAHRGREELDEARTTALAALGIRVLRVTNDEVLHRLPDVLTRISAAAREPAPTHCVSPPPHAGEGPGEGVVSARHEAGPNAISARGNG